MSKVYIIAGCRTPIGSFQGQFEKYQATELGTIAITEVLKRASLKPDDVDEVIIGNVLTSGLGQNCARQSAVAAKIPVDVPAYTINMLCGSGLKSVWLGFQAIHNEDACIVVVGGQECMTRAQHSAYLRGNIRFGTVPMVDTLITDGLTDAFENIHMGATAEHLAKEFSISRESQDKYALGSQTKTQNAIKGGYFKKEIVGIPNKKTGQLIESDEFPKSHHTMESLGKLPTIFAKNGSVTAGNASGINDGAAALVLASQFEVSNRNLKPLAEIVAFAQVGIEPMKMGISPIEAVKKVLNKAGWSKDDVDLYEINEAFAVQSIIVVESLQLDPCKVNITGGAIALGHPIGASGSRILVTLIHNLERLGKKRGVASLCVGGGMGIAIAIEMS